MKTRRPPFARKARAKDGAPSGVWERWKGWATRHRHPYDEIQFIREGRGVWTVGGKTFEGGAGDIFVIKAGEVHSFKVIGDSPLVQVDVHLSPRFIQENL